MLQPSSWPESRKMAELHRRVDKGSRSEEMMRVQKGGRGAGSPITAAFCLSVLSLTRGVLLEFLHIIDCMAWKIGLHGQTETSCMSKGKVWPSEITLIPSLHHIQQSRVLIKNCNGVAPWYGEYECRWHNSPLEVGLQSIIFLMHLLSRLMLAMKRYLVNEIP